MKIKELPVKSAVPAGGFVIITEPTPADASLSTFAKVPASALGGSGGGGGGGGSIWDGGASIWDAA